MKTYIGLLRGINVGGQKKIKMADLKRTLENIGFEKVRTYIQSGNIIIQSSKWVGADIERKVHDAIQADFGFGVPTLVLDVDEIQSILNENPFKHQEEKSLYYVLLKQSPDQDLVNAFNLLEFKNEDFSITNRCVYLCCKAGYGKAKLSNNLVEKKLRVTATARNLRTMKKLLEMAQD